MAPLGMAALENVSVSLTRLRSFLIRPDHFAVADSSVGTTSAAATPSGIPVPDSKETTAKVSPPVVVNVVSAVSAPSKAKDVVLELDKASFSWTGASEALAGSVRNVSLQIKRGTRTAIVGPVGSGKSTLIHGLVGELASVKGGIHRHVAKCDTGSVHIHVLLDLRNTAGVH
jgi:ATPase subunit of ABC transporter with duplicated ATPase domains